MEVKILIVIYPRSSSAGQSLELQLSSARRYLESEGLTMEEDNVIVLSDHDVSATKLKMNERPKLMELIKLIKEGKVKKVIAYKRDRFARNFYEFVDITKLFIKYDVDVVYTASNEPPYRKKLALEAFYGMFGQMEGENIRTRTNDARKQFPSSIIGYKRLKEDEQIRYIINQEKQESIVSLFTEFSSVANEEEVLEFLIRRRKGFNKPEKVLRILTNPFYAAHYESRNGLQALPHVEQMINLDLFLKVQSQVEKFTTFYEEKLNESVRLLTITPLCDVCANEMKYRRENILDAGYFVCSSTHKRLMIAVEELDYSVKQTVIDHVQSISAQLTQKIVGKHISSVIKRLQQEQDIAMSEYLDASLQLGTIELTKKHSTISKRLDNIRSLKKKYNQIAQDLISLQILSNEMKTLNTLLSTPELEFSQQDIQQLIELLVHKVTVHDSFVQVELFLSTFSKELDVS